MAEKGDLIKLAKVDIDDNADLALNYKVSNIKCTITFKENNFSRSLAVGCYLF